MTSLPVRKASKPLRRFARAERGTTAIEFAMIVPAFLLMISVMLESGFMLFTEYVLQTAVQKAAREIRTGQAQSGAWSSAAFKGKVCNFAGIIIDCSKITVYVRPNATFGGLRASWPSMMSVGPAYSGAPPNPTNYGCGSPLQAAGVMATYDWTFKIPGFMYPLGNVDTGTKSILGIAGIPGGKARRLVGVSIFRNEPFPASWAGC